MVLHFMAFAKVRLRKYFLISAFREFLYTLLPFYKFVPNLTKIKLKR